MRVLFAGNPAIAIPSLIRVGREQRLVGLLTNPASARGRGLSSAKTELALAAEDAFGGALPMLTFDHLGPEAREAVAALSPDILVSFAYGRIFGPKFLALFPKGGINVHPSLLPKYRGASPIQAAILARDRETGVSIQRIAAQLDCGEILGVQRIPLSGFENAEDLAETAALVGAQLLSMVLADIAAGRERSCPQEGEPCFCCCMDKDRGIIDWADSARGIDAQIRALYPWPGAHTFMRGTRLAVLEAAAFPDPAEARTAAAPGTILGLDKGRGIMVQTGEGLIALRRLQFEHKKALAYREFANGIRDMAGTVLGDGPSQEAECP